MDELYLDHISVGGVSYPIRDAEAEANAAQRDGYYEGADLTVRFADEIAASPYSGDAWAWIRARILTGNFRGIHIADYIPFDVTISGDTYTYNAQVAGINTYKKYGNPRTGNHIDFICDELWHERHAINKVNFNNGIAAAGSQEAVQEPWLCSDLYHWLNSKSGYVPNGTSAGGSPTSVNYTSGGMYYYLPNALKNVIAEKNLYLPRRYNASSVLTDDSGGSWVDIGKLWVPAEFEVIGAQLWGTKGHGAAGTPVQYPLFAYNSKRIMARNGDNVYDNWWLLNASAGESGRWCYVAPYGTVVGNSSVSSSNVGVPICFRIA